MSELRIERKPGTIHVVVTAVMSGLIAVIGYMTHMFLPHFVISVWPTTGLFAVAGIWFGAWGVLAAYIGNTVSCLAAFPLTLAAAQSVSTVFQALIPAWAFRRFKANPGLKTSRDSTIFMIWANVIAGFVSTLIGPTVWYLFKWVPTTDSLFYILMPGWFISNLIITPLIAIPLLKATSGAVTKSRAYVKRWLA
jgi:hypothetical protein